MADNGHSGQDRNLEPTAKRLQDARREGQVPRSRELGHVLMLGIAAAALVLMATPLMQSGASVVGNGLRFDAAAATEPAQMGVRLAALGWAAAVTTLPVLGCMLVAAVLGPLALGGFNFAPGVLEPKFDRLDPVAGIGRMFALRSLVELVKVMLIAALVGAVGAWFIVGHVDEFASLAFEGLPRALPHFGWLIAAAFALMVGALALVSAIDVPYQIWQHRQGLKMTLEEVKREHKETEGDPHIKARVRSAQREAARKRMMAAVPTADVVVTNPTHFAVALKYAGQGAAPIVVAKGTEAVAARIRELARMNGVPRLEAPPLARALYRHVEIGAEIPAALYAAVAQVLAYVYQLKRWVPGRTAAPRAPDDIEVPPGMDPKAA
jgi:flagellar biosynthetic protein FlhB